MIKILHRFFFAWIFLTKLPAPPLPKATKEDWGRIAPYFTFIGFVIGFILYFSAKLFLYFNLPVIFSALLLLLLWNLITGCLHLDGLMDTFDGINCQDQERKVDAMKDSRIGAFGAIAGIFVLLFKMVSLCTVFVNKLFFVILFTVPLARLTAVYALSFLSVNNKAGISSSMFTAGIKKPQDFLINLITIIVFFVLIALSPFRPIAPSLMSHILVFVLFGFFLCILWSHWLDNHFKGHSGDTYGALIELSETTILSLAVILRNYL